MSELRCSFYKTGSGSEPTREWLRSLRKDVRLAIGTDIAKVQRMWPVSSGIRGRLGQGLCEVRTSYERNEYPVLFCIEESTMVLLHGFQKKTQKIPAAELRLARQRQKGES